MQPNRAGVCGGDMVNAKISAGEPAYVNGERETVQVFDRPGSWVGLD